MEPCRADCRLEPPLPFAPPGVDLLLGAFDTGPLSGLLDPFSAPVLGAAEGWESSVDAGSDGDGSVGDGSDDAGSDGDGPDGAGPDGSASDESVAWSTAVEAS